MPVDTVTMYASREANTPKSGAKTPRQRERSSAKISRSILLLVLAQKGKVGQMTTLDPSRSSQQPAASTRGRG